MFCIRRNGNMWIVGCAIPPLADEATECEWYALKECATAEEAMALINYLNGGTGCVPGGYRFHP